MQLLKGYTPANSLSTSYIHKNRDVFIKSAGEGRLIRSVVPPSVIRMSEYWKPRKIGNQ